MNTMIKKLYFGDCLEVMQNDLQDESVDLIYLDPPFNSKRLYNAFIGDAQWVAFDDTWRWSEAVDDFHTVAQNVKMAPTMEGLRRILGESANLAYLSYMANRLMQCRRVLKPTGSIYLHCDPNMSHYLKIVMDGIFGRKNFRNEIVWSYQTGGVSKRWFGRKHDIILFYSKTEGYFIDLSRVREPRTAEVIRRIESGTPGATRATSIDRLPFDVWNIQALNAQASERVGYPTQKPLNLLDRIIKASSNKGDVVFDPFCGCGTTIHAAQALHRQWIGIDICVNACKIIQKRLEGVFADQQEFSWDDVEFIGMPKTLEDAKTLADMDKFRFERWAASLVDGMEANKKQRRDKGIDGRGRLPIEKGKFIDIVSQVKGGKTSPADVQAFNGARQQTDAQLGIFTCFAERVTQAMKDAAASAGRFMDVLTIQIYTIEDFFAGRVPQMPKIPKKPKQP